MPLSKILVVEDEEVLQMLMRDMLTDAGYAIDVASGKEAFLAAIEREAYDLVLLDYVLPDMNGFDALAKIKAQPSRNTPQVIMISAEHTPQHRQRALAYGVDFFLPKPFSPLKLLQQIGRMLSSGE